MAGDEELRCLGFEDDLPCPRPVAWTAEKLVGAGKGDSLTLCRRHYEAFRFHGRVGAGTRIGSGRPTDPDVPSAG